MHEKLCLRLLVLQVTLLNFTITQEGLSDQLLSVAVAEEKPDLEAQRQKLVVESAANKAKLASIETRILQVLSDSQGNILEDVTAVAILSEAKAVAIEVEEKQAVADETRKEIDEARKQYSKTGSANSVLFFAVRDLAAIDPMYQYSLSWFIKLFVRSIQVCFTSACMRFLCSSMIKDFNANQIAVVLSVSDYGCMSGCCAQMPRMP
jgi:dynein heavy chain, axonemal